MKTLHLVLKKEWFDMIAKGIKTEEYREIKPYWTKRLFNHEFDTITFREGYSFNNTMVFDLKSINIGKGKKEWGAPDKEVYVLNLGQRLR